ncbi:MAG: molybdopterin-guanine dinucleotide biosynthesis protein A [Alphaproteobacteria bacterium]|nr:molybdopterin-guanine dinucleotide biosynthesis protein A [Alphaproteobacteria bacterium]
MKNIYTVIQSAIKHLVCVFPGKYLAFLLCCFAISGFSSSALAKQDRHSGYYYTENMTYEVYSGRTKPHSEATENSRLAFVSALTKQGMSNPYPPDYVIFAKGEQSTKAILVSLSKNRYGSLYQLRALLAMLTSLSRTTPMFKNHSENANLTFLDMLHMMGFKQITLSNGYDVAHQIELK